MIREITAVQASAPIRDADFLPSGQWVAIAGQPATMVYFQDGHSISVPAPIALPIIRALDTERIVLVERRPSASRGSNAWVVGCDGSVLAEFHLGDGIEDVLASPDWIVVTYFDEGVLSSQGPSQQGLAVFRPDGRFEFGYRDQLSAAGVAIVDCYCACWIDESRVAFAPYTQFPFVMLDIRLRRQEVSSTPKAVHGAKAIAVGQDAVFFHAPYTRAESILAWPIGEKHAKLVGEHVGRLRGLRGGRFLGVQEASLVTLSLD